MRPQPIAMESPFAIDEVFFSKTDPKSLIQYGNKTFYETAKYTVKELVGKPHNIVRHPDMPKAIFKLLWQYIKADKPFAGYVKNMAKDGSYYWVYAIVFPIFHKQSKEGYFSVRIKPTTKFFDIAKSLYAKMHALEEKGESSEKLLFETLQELGYKSYDDFMIDALMQEFEAKEQYFVIDLTNVISRYPSLRILYENTKNAETIAASIYKKIAFFLKLSTTLEEQFSAISQITDDLSLIALNSSIESHKIGSLGASFTVVSHEIKKDSERISRYIVELHKNIEQSISTIKQSVLYLLSLHIQIFATLYYIKEIIESQTCIEGECANRLNDLLSLMHYSSKKITQLSKKLENDLHKTLSFINKIERLIKELHYIQVNGLIEAFKLTDEKFTIIFKQVQSLVDNTSKILEQVSPMINTSLTYTHEIHLGINEIEYLLSNIEKLQEDA